MHEDSGLEDAAAIYTRLLGGVPDRRQEYGYDLRLFDELPNAGLAAIHFRRRRFAEAARCFERAAQCAPGNHEYRVKRALALKLADQADTGDGRDAEGLRSQRSPGMVADLEVG
jgi:tetratricopeptide (TPR) repeat protein